MENPDLVNHHVRFIYQSKDGNRMAMEMQTAITSYDLFFREANTAKFRLYKNVKGFDVASQWLHGE